MKNEIKDVLMRALETELKSEDVRTYLVDTLVDNLLKLEEKAPQVQAEQLEIGMKVKTEAYGFGTIIRIDRDIPVVDFETKKEVYCSPSLLILD